MLIPVCGYTGSGADQLVRADLPLLLGGKLHAIMLKPHTTYRATPLKLARMIYEWEKYNPGSIIFFHWRFNCEHWQKLAYIFKDAIWLLAYMDTPLDACLNRLALDYLEGRMKQPADPGMVAAEANALNIEIKQAVGKHGLRVCKILHGVPVIASVAKLRGYIETAVKIQRSTIH